ncbi:YbhB/YbcL family Raf kinase inhibitor-like protein [Chitinophagaceae bacterium LB-8]|uniref:YbhB/YbcL family Raf kinase inhibitor-like protein n=1 Tax=Paraflavisolibacter caeni TaxID=2982496 RepID=A0A9X3BJI3_9BACT|nr:YbhB/YbcL family Raf kinase inhibitor-like protein [Paraflavisolibacter caeni]MCU7551228.1 YbhB/YbcL family Raf kinase inhibitor-like protein [Paraflavisolibacter caeni]
MKLESSDFKHGEAIPSVFTCQGEDRSPSLKISDVPAEAKSLVLILDDPDAPNGRWVHWLVWNIPPETGGIDGNHVPKEAVQGKNSWGRTSYGGPCPPSGTHRYFFKLYALDEMLSLSSADVKALEKEMEPYIIDQSELMGTYSKK